MELQWRRERPDLDPTSMAVFARLSRAHAHATTAIDATLAPFDLNRGEFDVLASLRRAGDPYALTAGGLAGAVVLSPSAMTNRLRRLEARGLVSRRPDPRNGRVVIVTLTPSGRLLLDRAVGAHTANLDRLLADLTPREVTALSDALARLGG